MKSIVCAIAWISIVSTSVLAEERSPASVPLTAPQGTSFAVELKKTIKASKARPGDEVRFETISPVLVSGLVIPAGSHLSGRVAGVWKQDNSEWQLGVLVDTLRLKDRDLSLYAFPTAFGQRRVIYEQQQRYCGGIAIMEEMPVGSALDREGRSERLRPCGSAIEREMLSRNGRESFAYEVDESIRFRKMAPHSAVPVVLSSTGKDLVLHGGTLMVIRNMEKPREADRTVVAKQ